MILWNGLYSLSKWMWWRRLGNVADSQYSCVDFIRINVFQEEAMESRRNEIERIWIFVGCFEIRYKLKSLIVKRQSSEKWKRDKNWRISQRRLKIYCVKLGHVKWTRKVLDWLTNESPGQSFSHALSEAFKSQNRTTERVVISASTLTSARLFSGWIGQSLFRLKERRKCSRHKDLPLIQYLAMISFQPSLRAILSQQVMGPHVTQLLIRKKAWKWYNLIYFGSFVPIRNFFRLTYFVRKSLSFGNWQHIYLSVAKGW